MSTPTDKSMRPMDSFVRVPHETQGPGGRERHPIDSDSEPIRPPYAPAKAREGADAEGDPGENDPLRSLTRRRNCARNRLKRRVLPKMSRRLHLLVAQNLCAKLPTAMLSAAN
jgi:hypothetical protein